MPDYRNMSSVEALRLAKERSGMTADEIALKLNVSTAVINRYLRRSDGYSPSLDMIPRLCSALNNTVLLDWLKAQVESPESVPQAKDRADVLMAVARADAALGDVSRILVETNESGSAATGINAGKAKDIRAGLEEVKKACSRAQNQLQAIAASDITERVVLNHTCLRGSTAAFRGDAPFTQAQEQRLSLDRGSAAENERGNAPGGDDVFTQRPETEALPAPRVMNLNKSTSGADRLEFSENRRLESSAALLSTSMERSAFDNGYEEALSMKTSGNDFPFGHIDNDNPRQKTATLKAVRVTGEIRGLLFSYRIIQEYKNETKQTLEVIYTFPVAWHTSLLGMSAVIGGKALAAQVIEKNAAETRYEEAVSGGDSAIMVQKSAKGLYTANLGNIMPGESVSIELSCAQMLNVEEGRARVCVPTVISERYGDARAQGGLAAHESVVTDKGVSYDFGASVAVMGGMAKYAVTCPSHGIRGQALEDGIRFAIDGTARLDRDFVLLIEGIGGVSQGLSAARDEENMVVASFTPILPQNASSALALKILVDCSGSMDGPRIRQAVKGLKQVLLELTPQDCVSYRRFGSDVWHMSKTIRPCAEDTLKKLSKGIEATDADMGGTEMEGALASAFALPLPKGGETMPAVLLITDGDVWAVDSVIKTAKASGHRVFAIGVGDSPAESLLREMAEQTGGACEFVTGRESMAGAIVRMFRRMRGSTAHDMEIDWGGETLWQSALPKFIYDGETVHCFASMKSVPDALPYLRWKADGREYSASVERMETGAPDELFRLGKVRQMEETEDQDEKKAIALKYQLISDKTSLILVHERAAEDKATGLPQVEHIRQMEAHRMVEECCCLDAGAPTGIRWSSRQESASMENAYVFSNEEDYDLPSPFRKSSASDVCCDMGNPFLSELEAPGKVPAPDLYMLKELAKRFNEKALGFTTVTECLNEILADSYFISVKEFLEILREEADAAEGKILDEEALWAVFAQWLFEHLGMKPGRHAERLIKSALAGVSKEVRDAVKQVCED